MTSLRAIGPILHWYPYSTHTMVTMVTMVIKVVTLVIMVIMVIKVAIMVMIITLHHACHCNFRSTDGYPYI